MRAGNKKAAPGIVPKTKPLVVVIKKRRKRPRQSRATTIINRSKPGLPNLTKQLTEAPASPTTDNDDDAFFPPLLEDAIPCDTLLAVQSLTSPTQSHKSLAIPLFASSEDILGILQSQIYPFLKQDTHKKGKGSHDDDDDHESRGMITRELQELFRKNSLRRLSSISTGTAAAVTANVTVLLKTEDYVRGVWDAHDGADHLGFGNAIINAAESKNVHTTYIQWFTDHLHRWTGRVIRTSELLQTWQQFALPQELHYQSTISLPKALDYFQRLQILMAHHHNSSGSETTYQLWLPHWGTVLSALATAQKKFLQKLRQTYQKELSEQSFVQEPFYNNISTRLLLQWMQDQGVIRLVPKPFGNFITLVGAPGNSKTTKMARK